MSRSDLGRADAGGCAEQRLGYVLKMYPRFSETFVVSELLAREAAGARIDIFSLRPPQDPRFHATLAAVKAPVTYLRHGGLRLPDVWAVLRDGQAELPRLPGALADLLAADPADAVQAVELAVHVRRRGITHLHAHFASVATTVARLASLLTGVPYSFTAHAKDVFHESVDPRDLATKLAGAHHVVTVSDFNVAYLRERYGVAAQRVTRVYNGIDLAAFPYTDPAPRSGTVAAVGRLVEKKGFDVLVEAMALLAARGVEARCVIAGTGPLEQPLRDRVVDLGLGDRVSLPGPLTQDEVREVIDSAAVFAAPCVVGADGNKDGLPTVLLEAMALGTPCVSTDVTGIPEVVRDGVTGLAVPQHDPAALAAAIERLLADASLRVRLARAARALVEQEFDGRQQARRLQALLADPAPAAAALTGSGAVA